MLRGLERRPDGPEAGDAGHSGLVVGPGPPTRGDGPSPDVAEEFVRPSTSAATVRGTACELGRATLGTLATVSRGGTVDSCLEWAGTTGVAGPDRLHSRIRTPVDAGILVQEGDPLTLAVDAAEHDQVVSLVTSALS